tara:strand:+ start:402 stop:584 length:183 start_codon:yes stop_codon:yes gene_type:complete
MTRILLFALAWAAAILGIALAGHADIIPARTAETLTIVLPALAVVSLGKMSTSACCGARA